MEAYTFTSHFDKKLRMYRKSFNYSINEQNTRIYNLFRSYELSKLIIDFLATKSLYMDSKKTNLTSVSNEISDSETLTCL